MKIVSVSMVRNEADVIETFVRYQCEIVDAMLIVDHASSDETPAILRRLRDEGLPLHLSSEDGAAYDQSRVVTKAAREAAGVHRADLVLPLDADEFPVARGAASVRAALEALPLGVDSYYRAPWVTYVPTAADAAEEENVLRRIQHRRKTEPVFVKVIIPGELIRRRKATVGTGSHGLLRYGRIWHRKHEHREAPGLAIAHFPVRSVEQLVRKVLVGWPAQLARGDRKPGEGGQWGVLFERFRRGELPTADELSVLALDYSAKDDSTEPIAARLVHDPVPPVSRWFDLRHGPTQSLSLEQLVQSVSAVG